MEKFKERLIFWIILEGKILPPLLLKANIYILDVFTEIPYSKSLELNVAYIPNIILRHSMALNGKWHQYKPWLSAI